MNNVQHFFSEELTTQHKGTGVETDCIGIFADTSMYEPDRQPELLGAVSDVTFAGFPQFNVATSVQHAKLRRR
jgi:hypothetical protein